VYRVLVGIRPTVRRAEVSGSGGLRPSISTWPHTPSGTRRGRGRAIRWVAAHHRRLRQADAMMRRLAGCTCTLLLAAGLLAGCGQNADRSAVAAAKCYLSVVKAPHPRHNAAMQTSQVEVADLGHGRYRVTGVAEPQGKAPSSYTCDVAPDSSDTLRGFRVGRLRWA
jgi:hypothetical protein